MKKELTKQEYDNYMKRVDNYIERVEHEITMLPRYIAMRRLSYEEWVKFQNGELKTKSDGKY